MTKDLVEVRNQQVVASSRQVAEHLEKDTTRFFQDWKDV